MKTDVYSSQVIGWEDRLQNDCNVSSGVLDHTIPTPKIHQRYLGSSVNSPHYIQAELSCKMVFLHFRPFQVLF